MNSIPYSRQWIDEKDIEEVVRVLRSDLITQGPKPQEFEEKIAEYCGSEYCVVFNSGTSALHAAYFSSGLKKDDEFITSPNSFVASANAGLYLNARPVFVDVEKDTGNIDVSRIEEKITEKTRLVVPVHYSGHPSDMEKIHHLGKKYKLVVIEDACHALGASYKGQKIGSLSDMTVFSFHPVKHITTGEGGAVTTENREFYERLLMFREHGITRDKHKFRFEPYGDWFYEMHFLGYNYRMTDIQAALGVSQMKKLGRFVERRRKIAEIYNDTFDGNPYFDLPSEKDYAHSSYHLYPIKLKEQYKSAKKEIFSELRENGLGVQVHYIPIYWQPYYQGLGYKKGLCPNAEHFYSRELSIPIYPAMTDKDVKNTISSILNTLKKIKI